MAELKEEIPAESIFHPDHIQQYILLTLLQIRDMLGMGLYLSAAGDPDKEAQVEALEKIHEAGKLHLDVPYLQ